MRIMNLSFFFLQKITYRRMKCSKDTINYSLDSKVRQRILLFSSSIQKLTNNLNAIQSTSNKKSIDLDSINKPSLGTNEQSSNLTFIE